jgi:hypothetical protein
VLSIAVRVAIRVDGAVVGRKSRGIVCHDGIGIGMVMSIRQIIGTILFMGRMRMRSELESVEFLLGFVFLDVGIR